jgi:hypothetical protein
VKIYVAAVEVVSKKEKQDEIQFTTKTLVLSFKPPFFAGLKKQSHPVLDQTS